MYTRGLGGFILRDLRSISCLMTTRPSKIGFSLGPRVLFATQDRSTKLIPTFNPIGYVNNNLSEPVSSELVRPSESEIVLKAEFVPGLQGLEVGQHILVLFYFHLSDDYDLLQHPRGDPERPKRGIFSLRSPRRPNPIGATVVELLSIQDNVLRVRGLDAVDGTPVLDIKPEMSGG